MALFITRIYFNFSVYIDILYKIACNGESLDYLADTKINNPTTSQDSHTSKHTNTKEKRTTTTNIIKKKKRG